MDIADHDGTRSHGGPGADTHIREDHAAESQQDAPLSYRARAQMRRGEVRVVIDSGIVIDDGVGVEDDMARDRGTRLDDGPRAEHRARPDGWYVAAGDMDARPFRPVEAPSPLQPRHLPMVIVGFHRFLVTSRNAMADGSSGSESRSQCMSSGSMPVMVMRTFMVPPKRCGRGDGEATTGPLMWYRVPASALRVTSAAAEAREEARPSRDGPPLYRSAECPDRGARRYLGFFPPPAFLMACCDGWAFLFATTVPGSVVTHWIQT